MESKWMKIADFRSCHCSSASLSASIDQLFPSEEEPVTVSYRSSAPNKSVAWTCDMATEASGRRDHLDLTVQSANRSWPITPLFAVAWRFGGRGIMVVSAGGGGPAGDACDEFQAAQHVPAARGPACRDRAAYARVEGGRQAPSAAGRDGLGQDVHDGEGDRGGEPPSAGAGAQQNAGGAALSRVQALLSGKRGGIFRELLRFLSAGSVCALRGHLHRQRSDDQRRAGQTTDERDAVAVRAAGCGDCCLGFVHLRNWLAGRVFRNAGDAGKGATDFAGSAAAAIRGYPVRTQRRFAARNVSRARRHHRDLSDV